MSKVTLPFSNFIKVKAIKVWLFLFFNLLNFTLTAQNMSSQVTGKEGNTLLYAWAGGMNSIQFGELDINLDGVKDLFAFDRVGNRKMCFINQGIEGQVDYILAPEYNDLLPKMFDWMILADYNNDGKEDIFTYSPGWAGMLVYENVSDNVLKFDLVVSPYLKSYQGGGYVNLLVTYVDYPGIVDIDNDGDLDIFSFWGLGSFLNYHKNLSMEKYGNADSLDYELVEYCWGQFAESDESNEIFLDTCLNKVPQNIVKERHTGSTLLFLDLDANGSKDLLLADIDYPGLYALMNEGSNQIAYIVSVDTMFPVNTVRANFFTMPAAAYIDVNNDGKKDLLVSPFDPALENSENKNSVWLYLNSGQNELPVFELSTKNFLQSGMIDLGSGAYPSLFDWDKDGLTDIFAGNFGYYLYSFYDENLLLHSVFQSRIAYYKNTGTENQPSFQLINSDFGNLGKYDKKGLVPTFGNLNADTQTEMICGEKNGKLLLLENLDNGQMEVVDENYFSIDVGDFSAPQLFDLDKDGLLDLIIGEKNGNLNYYRNQGTSSAPDFILITDSLGKVNVTDYSQSYFGYSTPCFFRNELGETELVVGSESGQIFYYKNIDGNLNGEFELSDLNKLLDTSGVSFDRGIRTAAAIGEIKQDGKPELIAGNFSGGLEYFNARPEVLPGFIKHQLKNENFRITPNPSYDGKISIENLISSGIYNFEIFFANGTLAMSGTFNFNKGAKTHLDISLLKPGFYFIRVYNSSKSLGSKFLVQ